MDQLLDGDRSSIPRRGAGAVVAPRKPSRSRIASTPILSEAIDRAAIKRRYEASSARCLELFKPALTSAEQSPEWREACAVASALFVEWVESRKG